MEQFLTEGQLERATTSFITSHLSPLLGCALLGVLSLLLGIKPDYPIQLALFNHSFSSAQHCLNSRRILSLSVRFSVNHTPLQ